MEVRKKSSFDTVLRLELQDKSLDSVAILTGTKRDFSDYKVETVMSAEEFQNRYKEECSNDIMDLRVFSDIDTVALYMLKFSVGVQILNGIL